MADAAGSVQFGLTLGPLDGALQPSAEETLEGGGGGGERTDGGGGTSTERAGVECGGVQVRVEVMAVDKVRVVRVRCVQVTTKSNAERQKDGGRDV